MLVIVNISKLVRTCTPGLHRLNINSQRLSITPEGWGLFVCILAMLSAAFVEFARLEFYKKGRVLPDRINHGTRIVQLSVFWQIPQYLLVGLSEVST